MRVLNKSFLVSALAISVAGGVYSGVVNAVPLAAVNNATSGMVTVTGRVIAAPCSVLDENTAMTIKLGDIALNDLIKNGHGSFHPVHIQLTGCVLDADAVSGQTAGALGKDPYSTVTVKFSGDFGAATDNSIIKNTVGTAKSVGVALYDKYGHILPNDSLVTSGVDYTLFSPSTDIEFWVAAAKMSTGTPTTGDINVTINYTLSYK